MGFTVVIGRLLREQRRRRAAKRRRIAQRGLVFLLVLLLGSLLGTFFWSAHYLEPNQGGKELTQNQLQSLIEEHRVVRAVFQTEDAQVVGTWASAPVDKTGVAATAKSVKGEGVFRVPYPKSDALTGTLSQRFAAAGAIVTFDPQKKKSTVRLVTTFLLPLMILANLFTLLVVLTRSNSGSIGEVLSFGSIGKDGRRRKGRATISFDDVAGADEAVAELREVRDYLKDPSRYKQLGAQPPKGVLLFGPPGCGKTLLAKAVAGEAGVPFFSVAGAEFVESLVGVGAARVRDLFKRVRAVAPAIVFIDELDAAGRKRTSSGAGGSEERDQTLNQLLVEMDGFDVSSGIVVMAATNRPDIIDPALMRPGRFDRHVTVDQPDVTGRRDILELHARNKPIDPAVDFGAIARRTPGFTGADLANVVNEAALLAVRAGHREITASELEEAVHRVLSGPQRRGRMLSPAERERVAYHEAGHAVAAAATGRSQDLHRVSIVARAGLLGSTGMRREDDSEVQTSSDVFARLVGLLGGVAAEQLVFGECSTGIEHDLEAATTIARDMVGRWGMSGRIGRARLATGGTNQFLGPEFTLAPVSGATQEAFDLEVKRLLDEAEEAATELLMTNRRTLDEMARTLVVDETLEGAELELLLVPVRPRVRAAAAGRRSRKSTAASAAMTPALANGK